jgi:prevent-host-death family protein
MNAVPETIPISELRQRQNEILSKLYDGPVLLTQHGRAAAVLVDPEQWNWLVEAFEDLHDALEVRQIKARIDAGEEEVIDWAEFEADLDAIPA